MSVNNTIDPRFLYHVEEESPRFRVGESGPKSRELDRRFESSEFRQGFCGNEKDEMRYSNGDDDDDEEDCGQRRGSLIQPGIDSCSSVAAGTNREISAGWELVVRDEDDEEEKSFMVRHHKVMIANSQAKRDFASVEKERVNNVSAWESLKSILSDPVTGALMSDATILPCGHSFGAGGLKEVNRMKACFTCSQPTSEGSEKPNLSLRIVVHAFRQEEEADHVHSLKRRKERSDQHKRTFCIPKVTETPKSSSRGIQFPFSIGDRIIIEGNKRTPPRFVGRKAVIMTHCLNGWYVVKTVDNGDSIKLQHCSLAKIPSDNSPSKVTVAEMAPSWLSSS